MRDAAAAPPANDPDAPAATASEPERALDLALRPGWRIGRSPPAAAADEQRAHAEPATLQQRMTNALGNRAGRAEELLADGTRRIRDGGHCWLLHPSRAAGLFPFEGAAVRAPGTAEACD